MTFATYHRILGGTPFIFSLGCYSYSLGLYRFSSVHWRYFIFLLAFILALKAVSLGSDRIGIGFMGFLLLSGEGSGIYGITKRSCE
jgi:hypothetical protein